MFRVYPALITVQVLFALWPVAGAVALEEVSPPALIGYRTFIGGPLLFASISAWRPWPSLRDGFALAVLAFFGITANQLLYAEGLKRAGPINALVLIIVIPASTLVLGTLLGRERPNLRRALGVAVAILGVMVLVRAERLDTSSETFVGNLLILGNTTSYALYLVLAKPVIARVGALNTVGWVFLFGALEALPWTAPAVASTDWSSLAPATWIALAFIVAGPTIGTYFLNAYALKYVDASVVAIFVGLQPMIGALGAWIVLGEVPTSRTAVAAMIIIAGVLLASGRVGRTKEHRPTS